MIVRIALWRLDETTPSFDELRRHQDDNEAAERVGALLVTDDDEPVPPQLDELRRLVGRDPDLYEEFDIL